MTGPAAASVARPWRRALGGALGAAVVLVPAAARADLASEAAALARAWKADGAEVTRLPPAFSFGDDEVPVATTTKTTRRCTSWVAIATRTTGLRMRPRGAPAGTPLTEGQAGVVQWARCGDAALERPGIDVSSTARGAVERLVVVHDEPLRPVASILPVRAVGPKGRKADLGGGIAVAPLRQRMMRAGQAMREEGAVGVRSQRVRARADGSARLGLALPAGCHRLALGSAPGRGAGGPIDLDALVRVPGESGELARDRSHAPDARLDFCLGRAGRVQVSATGGHASGELLLWLGHWPAPRGLPRRFGPTARRGLMHALRRAGAPSPATPPVASWIGGPGATHVAHWLPAGCYVGAAAVFRGEASALRLSIDDPLARHGDDAQGPWPATAVAHCLARPRAVTWRVDARADTAWWRLALWRVGPVAP